MCLIAFVIYMFYVVNYLIVNMKSMIHFHMLTSQGLTVCSETIDGEKLLLAFGGYNGKYNNEVSILSMPQSRILESKNSKWTYRPDLKN